MGVPQRIRKKANPPKKPASKRPLSISSPYSLQKLTTGPVLQRSPAARPKGWKYRDLINIQRQLRRLGLYPYRKNGHRLRIDGTWGDGTRSALVEAYGGYSWQNLPSSTVITNLKAAKKPKGRRRQHNFRYGEMFSDKWLELSVSIGFDENGRHAFKRKGIVNYLTKTLGYKHLTGGKASAAHSKINKDTGKGGGSTYGDVLLKKNALLYKPPVGKPRKIHIAVYLITTSGTATGEKAKKAVTSGMAHSDVSFYTGHGRYGSGPDFDSNFGRFDFLDKDGKVTRTFLSYKLLKYELKEEGKRYGRGAWSQFRWRLRNKRIRVSLTNKGNLFTNARNKRRGSFGANLIFWALKQKAGGGTLVTGRKGSLAKELKSAAQKRPYRMWVFAGCSTRDYRSALRSTPGVKSHSTDIIFTKKSVRTLAAVNTFQAFFSQLIAQSTAEVMIKKMNDQNPDSGRNPYVLDGFRDNPFIP